MCLSLCGFSDLLRSRLFDGGFFFRLYFEVVFKNCALNFKKFFRVTLFLYCPAIGSNPALQRNVQFCVNVINYLFVVIVKFHALSKKRTKIWNKVEEYEERCNTKTRSDIRTGKKRNM